MSEPPDTGLLHEIYPVSRETVQRLSILVECVRNWQRKTNLVSPGSLEAIWTRHIADSLQCVAIKPDASSWVDLGSGGGFPGLVIAAVMADWKSLREPQVHLIESNQKKAAFLRHANREMGTGAVIHCERVESVSKQFSEIEIVTARAFAPLCRLLEMAEPLFLSGATGLFHKGRGYASEIEECDGVWKFDLVSHASKTSEDSVLLEISNLQRAQQQAR